MGKMPNPGPFKPNKSRSRSRSREPLAASHPVSGTNTRKEVSVDKTQGRSVGNLNFDDDESIVRPLSLHKRNKMVLQMQQSDDKTVQYRSGVK